MGALDQIASWEAPNTSGAVVAADGSVVATQGDIDRPFRLASITKVVVGWTAMIAVEEGVIALDDAAGQPGCTLRHLLAHAGGYPFDGAEPISEPGRRRIYSNTGIEVAASAIEQAAGLAFATYLAEAVLQPLGMDASELRGSPAHGMTSTVRDLTRLLAELQHPTLISPAGAAECVTVHYPDLGGIVPGVGRFDPCPWGLGIEIRGDKTPHWTGTTNAPSTFGHFGGAGTMAWVDPTAGCALVALADRPFDDWPGALEAWRTLSDDVVAEHTGGPAA
jgi:CubicO group peptidase (beta-lactamase class C family)